jgi:hypothetical protein
VGKYKEQAHPEGGFYQWSSLITPRPSLAPFGQYSHVARVELGDRVFLRLSGQAAIDADGEVIGNDMATQA